MRLKKGVVSSSKMNKTIIVNIDSYKRHSKYKKRFKVTKKFYAHDEQNKFKDGDMVTIKETRPLSKLKRWEIVE